MPATGVPARFSSKNSLKCYEKYFMKPRTYAVGTWASEAEINSLKNRKNNTECPFSAPLTFTRTLWRSS